MSFDWSKIISPEQVTRNVGIKTQIQHLYALSDRFLAQKILNMARAVRNDFPEKLGDPFGDTCDPGFVWHVIPEIAKRLGASGLQPNEAKSADIVSLTDNDFRVCVGSFLKGTIIGRWSMRANRSEIPWAGELLTRDPANGNPVAFALDRLYPVQSIVDKNDWIAQTILEVSQARGFDPVARWTPELVQEKLNNVTNFKP